MQYTISFVNNRLSQMKPGQGTNQEMIPLLLTFFKVNTSQNLCALCVIRFVYINTTGLVVCSLFIFDIASLVHIAFLFPFFVWLLSILFISRFL